LWEIAYFGLFLTTISKKKKKGGNEKLPPYDDDILIRRLNKKRSSSDFDIVKILKKLMILIKCTSERLF